MSAKISTEDLMKGNKLIAEFMELKSNDTKDYFFKNGYLKHVSDLPYHKSWNWIIPVCKKFDNLYINAELRKHWAKGTSIGIEYRQHCKLIDHSLTLYEIEKVYGCLVTALQWYNQNILTNKPNHHVR